MDFSASRTVHGEFKIQSIENNYVCGNAGRMLGGVPVFVRRFAQCAGF
jgi:hypothetical protein